MISDLDLCDLCQKLYDETTPVDFWTKLWPLDGAYCAVKHLPDADVTVFRGTATPHEWMQDFNERPIEVAGLGFVHAGFWEGVSQVMHEVEAELHDHKREGVPWVVTGHSLGAARAPMFAAWLMHEALGYTSVLWVSFAMPRPGFRELVQAAGLGRWYRNDGDKVTDVPLLFGLYKHPGSCVLLNVPAPNPDPWGPFAQHHLALYRQGIAALP